MNQQPQESKGLSIASMVLGILSCTCCCGAIGIFMGIAAIVMGAIGKNKGGRGMAIAGIICGSIGVVVGFLWTILSITGTIWNNMPDLWSDKMYIKFFEFEFS